MGQVAPAGQHRLGQRDQQLGSAESSAADLEAPDPLDGHVQPLNQVELGAQVPDQQQPGVAGQGGVVGAASNGGAGYGTLQPLGASCWESMGV
jgi:hypothetical protein